MPRSLPHPPTGPVSGQPPAAADVAHTSPSSSPAASTAIGSSDVSVMPGDTFTSRNCTSPSGVDDRVGPGQVPQPEHLVRARQPRRRPRVGDLGRQPRRRVVGRRTRRVPGRVVEDPAGRHDLHRGQRDRPVAEVDHRDRHLDPVHVRLHAAPCPRTTGRTTIAAGSSAADRIDPRRPSAEPPCAGFTISGSPSRSTIRSSTAAAPSSRNVECGSATQSGVVSPAARTAAFAVGLSQAIRQAAASEPTYRTPARSSTDRSAPSSPAPPCSAMNDGVRPVARQRGEQLARPASSVRTATPACLQRLVHPPAGAERDLPLVRQPAGQDHDRAVRLAHRRIARRHRPALMRVRPRGRADLAAVRTGPRRGPKRRPQLQLLLHHAGESAHALADPVRRWGSSTTGASPAGRSRRRRSRCRGRTRPARRSPRGCMTFASSPSGSVSQT